MMSDLSPKYYELKEDFEQYKANPNKLPAPDRPIPSGMFRDDPGVELARIEQEVEREIRDWRQASPLTTESKKNLDAFKALQSDINAWKVLNEHGAWGRFLTGRKLVAGGLSLFELIQVVSSRKGKMAYLRAWNPIDGFQVADLSELRALDPEFDLAGWYDFPFISPQGTEEMARWVAELLGFVFDLDDVLRFLPEGKSVHEELLRTPYTSHGAALEAARRELEEEKQHQCVGEEQRAVSSRRPSPSEMLEMHEKAPGIWTGRALGEKFWPNQKPKSASGSAFRYMKKARPRTR